MKRNGVVLLLLLLLGSPSRFTVVDARGQIDAYVRPPAGTAFVSMSVACDHTEQFSARASRLVQEHFVFRDLHEDTYAVQVRFEDSRGRVSSLSTTVFVSRG